MNATPVAVVSAPDPPVPQPLICSNCGAPLGGEYCSACGQRHEPHVHSVRHFFAEAFESLTHADSRLWRTLWFLLSRPGKLTLEFFKGHRVGYLPPFRLYLVISLVFFLVAGLPDQVNVNIEPAKAAEDEAALAGDTKSGLQDENLVSEICAEFRKSDPKADASYARLQAFCSRPGAERTRAIGEALVHNLPRAMFVFLPLLAFSMKLLYWRPKRYYVEHLLLLVHNHAFVFLALAIVYLLQRIPVVGEHLGLLEFAVWVYIVWYIFRAMRNYYAQSRSLTFVKYLAIGLAYFSTSVLVLALTSIFIAFTL
jgi:hypothetical protein